jgi:malate dehydrogenase (oxaloacetate-decarboxylating)(NADP+)
LLDFTIARRRSYSPGVAEPCLEIQKHPDDAFKYTARANLVAVVSNGTAVLGLGNIGALAGKPVMEGKGVLFKRFAGIDVFDIELATEDPELVIQTVKLLEPTFGGINLEDIRAPECFEIEERLIAEMDIPVFHDDQHGTAIISAAAFLNALELTKRKIENVKVVVAGAGAAGIACADLYVHLGVRPENVLMTDSKGVLYQGRTEGMNKYKAALRAQDRARSLADAMRGADAFVGVVGRHRDQGHGQEHGAQPHHLPRWRTGSGSRRPRSPPCATTITGRAIPEPGQQRARLPVHLRARSTCARARSTSRWLARP